MSYRKISNLYSDDRVIRLCKRVYALEKIHGTSAKVGWKDGKVWFFSGGAKHESFVALFDEDTLTQLFRDIGHGDDCPITVYGEAYGGKLQGMSDTYGKELKFVAFEVKVDTAWLNVPNAENVARDKLGLDFVDYQDIPCTLSAVDGQRDKESVQALRNGMGEGHKREGVVLRPLEELRKANGDRLMAKHKSDAFAESRTPQPRPGDPAKQAAMKAAQEYADEYVVAMRLSHVVDGLGGEIGIKDTGRVIQAMTDDILTEEPPPEGMDPKLVRKTIGKATALLFRRYLETKMREE